jgi:hypothetical protein
VFSEPTQPKKTGLLWCTFLKDFGYLWRHCPAAARPSPSMPRFPNFPTTCDATQRLELSFLRKQRLLRPGVHATSLQWSSRGQPSGSIGLEAHIWPGGASYLRLYYTVNDTTKYDYRVQLEAVASNLPGAGSSTRFYLVCPKTGRRATILYLRTGTGIFAHRLAFPAERLYYDSQLEVKRFRGLSKYFAADREWEREYRKGRKTTYRGKPTRWYARLLNLEQQGAAAAPGLLKMLNGY